MRALVVKELERNQGFLISYITLLAGALCLCVVNESHALCVFLGLGLPLVSLFLGATLISEEQEESTMEYLFTLPVDRRTIWVAKFATGLLVMLLGCFLYLAVASMLKGPALVAEWNRRLWWSDIYPFGLIERTGGFVVAGIVLPFTVGYFFSTVVDRLSTAVMGALGTVALLELLILAFTSASSTVARLVLAAGFLAASFLVWVKGSLFESYYRLIWGLTAAAALAAWILLVVAVL